MKIDSLTNEADTGFNSKNKLGALPEDAMAVKDKVHGIGKKIGSATSDMASATADRYQLSRIYVKKHPTRGVLAATAVGVALGSILTVSFIKK